MIDYVYNQKIKKYVTPWYRLFSYGGCYIGMNFMLQKVSEDDEPIVRIASILSDYSKDYFYSVLPDGKAIEKSLKLAIIATFDEDIGDLRKYDCTNIDCLLGSKLGAEHTHGVGMLESVEPLSDMKNRLIMKIQVDGVEEVKKRIGEIVEKGMFNGKI